MSFEAYASATTAEPGQPITIFARTNERSPVDAPLRIYRCPDSPGYRQHSGNSRTIFETTARVMYELDGTPESGCHWNGTSLVLGDWPSGLYLARVGADDVSGDAYFVVRRPDSAPNNAILVIVPFTTIQAYNDWGGRSFYTKDSRAPCLSFWRPTPFWRVVDAEHGHIRFFLDWMDRNIADRSIPSADYVSSIDLARGDYALFPNQYRLIITVGHDEYWSDRMVDNMLNYVWQGGNIAFLSGNTCDGKVTFSEDFTTMCSNNGERWRDKGAKDFSLIGVQTPLDTSGGDQVIAPYEIRIPEHWIMQGVDDASVGVLAEGGTVVGYEVDVVQAASPASFEVVGKAPYNSRITTQFGMFRNRNGLVFSAGTTGWSRGLARHEAGRGIDIITRNVIQRLSGVVSAS